MDRTSVVLILSGFLVAGCWENTRKHPLQVTYIANEGFALVMGDTKILIDAFPRSKYYLNPTDTLAAKLVAGFPPFDNVDYVLVTHDHADHFNAEMMSRFLLHHPAANVIASSVTCGKFIGDSLEARRHAGIELAMGQHRTVRGSKADITVMRLDHGGGADICNFAYIVRSNGYTIVHTGDARLSYNEEYLRTVNWSSYDVDLLFMEYFDHSSQTQDIIESLIKPRYVIFMHIPPGEEDSVRNAKGKIHPRTVVFGRENETMEFDAVITLPPDER